MARMSERGMTFLLRLGKYGGVSIERRFTIIDRAHDHAVASKRRVVTITDVKRAAKQIGIDDETIAKGDEA